MEKIRTFVAVQLPQEIHRRLAKIVGVLSGSGADVKWVAEDNFHVTMKFLGPVEQDHIPEVLRAIGSSLSGLAPFDLQLTDLGAFPRITHPSVIWAGISTGSKDLKTIAARLEAAMEPLGFKRESREFSAHVTLGRVRSMRGSEQLRASMERLRNEEIGHFTVQRIAVMKSDLKPSGPVYTPIAEFELEGTQRLQG